MTEHSIIQDVTTPKPTIAADSIRRGLTVLLGLLPLVFNPFVAFPFEQTKATVLHVGVTLLLALIGGMVSFNFRPKNPLKRLREHKLLSVILLYIIIITLSTLFSQNIPLSIWGDAYDQHGMLTLLCSLLVGAMAGVYFRDSAERTHLFTLIALCTIPICFYGMLQLLGYDLLIWESDSLSPVSSTLGRSNFVAAYLAILLPLTFYAAQTNTRKSLKFILIGTFFLQLATLLVTQARAGWLAAFAGLCLPVFIWLLARRQHHQALVISLGLFITAVILVSGFQQWRHAIDNANYGFHTYAELRTFSLSQRVIIWQNTLALAQDAGAFGFGPESFSQVFEASYPRGSLFNGNEIVINDPHNLLLHELISHGFLGLLAYVLMVCVAMGRIINAIVKRSHGFMPLALLGGLSAYVVQGFLTPDMIATTTLFWVLIGLTVSFPKSAVKRHPPIESENWDGLVFGRTNTPSTQTIISTLQRHKTTILALTSTMLIGGFMRLYNVGSWLRFTGDETRDAMAAWEIAQGQVFPLIGPKIHEGYGFLGPAYYYISALPLLLTGGDPASIGWLVALVDVAAIGMLFVLVRLLFNVRTALIAALLYGISFQVVFYARWGWHPSLVPFIVFLIIWAAVHVQQGRLRYLPLGALGFAIGLQLHLTMILLLPALALATFFRRKQLSIPLIGFTLITITYPFLPLILFEFTNDFPNLRGAEGLFARKTSEAWASPLGYLVDSMQTIATAEVMHKNITLFQDGGLLRILSFVLVLVGFGYFLQGWRHQRQHQTYLILLSWMVTPLLAIIAYSGFRPDYYLITWFAVPLLFAAIAIDRLIAQKGGWSLLGLITLVLLVGANGLALKQYAEFMNQLSDQYSFFHGVPLRQREQLVEQIIATANGDPYNLAIATWSWPNHQPYNFLLSQGENTPANVWLFESATGETGPFTPHWIDTRRYFPVEEPVRGIEDGKTLVIVEPSSLPLPEEFVSAELVTQIGGVSLFEVVDQ